MQQCHESQTPFSILATVKCLGTVVLFITSLRVFHCLALLRLWVVARYIYSGRGSYVT